MRHPLLARQRTALQHRTREHPHRRSLPIAGASSGGHLAMLAATADESAGFEGSGGWPNVLSRVKAVVSYNGPTDFRPLAADFGVRAQAAITKLIGVPFADHRDRYACAARSSSSPPVIPRF